jgi:ankyrin repeat protein
MFEWFVEEYHLNINPQNTANETPFIVAAREGKLEFVQMIIEKYSSSEGFDIDEAMFDGWTAFAYAAINGYFSVVDYLGTKGGANINCKDRL